METFDGGCHCGRVRFRVTADLDGITDCSCSVCTKKGFLHLIVPESRFELVSGRDEQSTYRFNTGVARHLFCRTCGIHSYYVPRSDPDKVDVNVRCLDGIDLGKIVVHPFNGRDWESSMKNDVPWRTASAPVTVLAYDGCSTCKAAIKWLTEHGVAHSVRPIVDEPPTQEELAAWIPASGLGVRKWLNTSGQSYRALGKEKVDAASDRDLVRWLTKDGKLVKRPVVVWGERGAGRVTVGFRAEAFEELAGPSAQTANTAKTDTKASKR